MISSGNKGKAAISPITWERFVKTAGLGPALLARVPRRWRPTLLRTWRCWPYSLLGVFVVGLYLVGALTGLDRWLIDGRFEILARPASGELVVVEIDAHSLAELDVWPWPREFHARMIDRLVDANAREIAVDVDFSSYSRPAQDHALAAALARADGRVILPVFRQLASTSEEGTVAAIDTAPLPMFREHAQLGGVTLVPGSDGLVRATTTTENREGRAIPTVAALLAGPAALEMGRYRIDFGIRPSTLPRYSFVEVLQGEVPDAAFAGRKVIVGAAAAELGDQHAVPVYRAVYGPVLQALSFESLVQGRTMQMLSPEGAVLVTVMLALFLGPLFNRLSWKRGLVLAIAAVAVLEGIAIAAQALWPVLITSGVWLLTVALSYALSILRSVEVQGLQLFRQRMALVHRRTIMHRVLEDSFDGVAITDVEGNIEALNSTAAVMLGIDRNTALGKRLRRVVPDVAELIEGLPVAQLEEQTTHYGPVERTLHTEGDNPLVVEVIVGRSILKRSRHPKERRVRNRVVYSFTFRDMTARAQAEAAQRRAVEEAEAASRAKSEFLANMSHELRTPLNAIIGFSEMVTAEVLGPVQPPQYAGYIRDIEGSGRHLLSVINDILDVSKIESGRFDLHENEIALDAVLESGARILHGWPEAEARHISVRIDEDLPTLVADERLIKQIVVNLLSNAVKYSGEGDRITLGAACRPDGRVMIEVADTGIGIEERHLPELTKPFYQTDSSLARKYEGTGLGLSLVAAYIKAHDGDLEISSTYGVGTTVRLLLPAWRVVRAAEPGMKRYGALSAATG